MPKDRITTGAKGARAKPSILFTPETANRALIYVRPIIEDLVAGHRDLLAVRAERDALFPADGNEESVGALHRRIDALVERLNRLHEELIDVGCILKDWSSGLVDFPALHDGRKVWLCWRLGESEISHWHELHLGFSNRQTIGPDFQTG